MTGFGSGGFGQGGFGESRWARVVFWEGIPEVYRLQDEQNGNVFYKFMDGVSQSFDAAREKIRNWEVLRDPLHVRTKYDETVTLRVGKQVTILGELEQTGMNGAVDSIKQFSSTRGRFTNKDVGKELTIKGSSNEENNKTVSVVRVLDGQTVLTDPQLQADAGPLRWELRSPVVRPDGVITVQIQSGYVDEITPGWLLSDGFSEYKILARRHFPRKRNARQIYVEKEGSDGQALSGGTFRSTAGQFLPSDIGKKLVITGGNEADNEGTYEIVSISGTTPPQELTLDSALVEDAGPYFWAVLPFPELDIETRVSFRGVALQGGVDLQVTPPNAVSSMVASFTQEDVGTYLSIRGSANGYDGLYQITAVSTPNDATLDAALVGAVETGLAWDTRQITGIGDGVQVTAHAPSMLEYLAKDFGITIDERESEDIQRKWVKNVSGWINIKGLEAAYEAVGRLGGLIVSTSKLYRVTADIYDTISSLGFSSSLVELGEPIVGRYGQDGVLAAGVTFTANSATFKVYDVGRQVAVYDASTSSNNKLYTIEEVISETEVRFRASDSAVVPDYGIGGTASDPTIRWSIVRLYTTKPPKLPNFDDFVPDLMEEIIDDVPPLHDYWSLDKFCWEPDFYADVAVDLISVTAVAAGVWSVVVETPVGQAGSADVVVSIGNWQFLDKSGQVFYLQTVPVDLGGGQFSFQVNSILQPDASGAEDPILRYVCSENSSCSYCASNKILISIELGPELSSSTGLEVENILQRALDRMEQAKPLHAEFVVVFRRTIDAGVTITASVETHPDVGAMLTAYFQPHYDDIEGDVQEADHGVYGSVEPVIT